MKTRRAGRGDRIVGVPLGLFVVMSLGLVLLMLGVVWLFIVAEHERKEALAQIPEQRRAAEWMFARELADALEAALGGVEQELAVAVADPLVASGELLLIEDGAVVLPRPGPRAEPSVVSEIADRLEHAERWGELDGEQAARHQLARRAGDGADAYAAWLDHRARFRLDVGFELASTLWAIEVLDQAGDLDPERARALFRDGVTRPDGRVEGLFPRLLLGLARLSRADVEHVLTRASEIARRYVVRVDDVLERVREPTVDPQPLLASAAQAVPGRPTFVCVAAACWVVRKEADGRVSGRAFDLTSRLDTIADTWRRAGRVPADSVVRLAGAPAEPRVDITSATWERAADVADERFVMKVAGLGIVGLLGVVVFVMAIVMQRRRTAYIDLRGQLLRAVTHELKTPLASISALAQTLELRLGAEHPQARDYPARIVASAERLAFLVDNVLSFARLERGAWTPRMETLAVADLARWLAADPVARAVRPIDLEVDVPPDLTLVGDPDLVRLLLSNLLDNAAKYALADRVHVRLSARRDARGVHLAVTDDGPGLGVSDPTRLFEDFMRGRVGGVRGTGLGLSICRWVVALHGGIIQVLATGPEGTTFEATFPALSGAS